MDRMHTLAPPRPRRATPPDARPGRRRRSLLFLHETRALVRVAGPIVVSQLGGIAMNTTDTIMVGPLGAHALAAAGLGNAIFMALLMVCTGTLLGMSPLVSQAFGAGDRAECRRVLVQGVWLAAILAVPMTLVCFFGLPIARALAQPQGVSQLAGGYLAAIAWGVLPMMLFMAFRQYLDGMSLTRPAMLMTFLGVAVNVAGNYLLIYGFEVRVPVAGTLAVPPGGLVGAGWSTTLVRWSMFAAMVIYILRRRDLAVGVRLAPVAARLRRMAVIGAPIGVQLLAEVGVFAFAVVMMGWLSPVAQAAHQVTINIASATFMVALGTSLAGSIRVGQHVGARSPRGVHRAVLSTYLLVTAFMALCALVFLAAPRWLLGLYTDDPAIIQVGLGLMVMAAAFQVFDGAQVAGLCALRGAADTRVPMWMTVLGYWVIGAPVAYLLGFHTAMGAQGVWLGLVVSLVVVSVLLGWRTRRVLWDRPLPATP
ncbi:MAG: MATE family efflux transporter [Gemmatimonadetes bacterium]|nr:MATE family efflux transporter [Gemmatimonadota bacterium]